MPLYELFIPTHCVFRGHSFFVKGLKKVIPLLECYGLISTRDAGTCHTHKPSKSNVSFHFSLIYCVSPPQNPNLKSWCSNINTVRRWAMFCQKNDGHVNHGKLIWFWTTLDFWCPWHNVHPNVKSATDLNNILSKLLITSIKTFFSSISSTFYPIYKKSYAVWSKS